MNKNELAAVLEKHRLWRSGDPAGQRADLTGADLSGADLARANMARAYLAGADLTGAYLSGAYLAGADLTGAYLAGAKINFIDHTLLSEILFRAAGDDQNRQMVAAWVDRRHDLCWPDFLKVRHPEKRWALEVLADWVQDGDNAPDFLRRLAHRRKAE